MRKSRKRLFIAADDNAGQQVNRAAPSPGGRQTFAQVNSITPVVDACVERVADDELAAAGRAR